MRSRTVPGTSLEVSELSFDLGTGSGPSPSAAAGSVAVLVNRAVEAGVSLFDASRVENPETLSGVVERAFASLGRHGTLIVPWEEARPASPSGGDFRQSLSRPGGRLTVWVRDRSEPGPTRAAEDSKATGIDPNLPNAVSVQLEDWEPGAGGRFAGRETATGRPRLFSVDGNLLSTGRLSAASQEAKPLGAGILVRDPFAGGRLSGRWVGAEPLPLRAGGGPVPLESLQAQWAPVLRLQFLTAGRRRTMPVAALQFALSLPGVVSVLVPFEQVTDLQWITEVERAPPLTPSELREIGTPRATRAEATE